MKCLLMGCGGRETIIAEKLIEKFELYIVMPYENPTMVEFVNKSNGKMLIDKSYNKENIKSFIYENKIEYCVVNSDGLLQDGMIDLAKECGLKTFGPTKNGARVEWDKEFTLELVEKIAPEIMIKSYVINNEIDLENVKNSYSDENFVVKPNGLTAGKGVKVGGVHFLTKQEGIDYAEECLKKDGVVIVQDKIVGHEFTIMGITDGEDIVFAPTTYDYPYRFNDDKGPGTGGMGCVSLENGLLSFLTEEDIQQCHEIMTKALKELNKDSKEFNGVLYGAFFKTADKILFIEFNSRLGDPECLNVLSVLDTPFADIVCDIANGESIKDKGYKFNKINSYVLYIVSKGYAVSKSFEPIKFDLNNEMFKEEGLKVYFSATKKEGERYVSTGNSRLFALVKTGDDLKKIKEEVDGIAKKYITDDALDYRTDIGSEFI